MSEDAAAAPATTVNPATRRGVLLAVAGGALLAGAGLAWWRLRPGAVDDTALGGFWQLNFQTPGGQSLAMTAFQGRPLLINFWATWCPPCVEEMPLLDAFFREQGAKGFQVLGLAIDQPSAVRSFLGRTPVTFPIGLAGVEGTELTRKLGNLTGGLPFTVVLDADARVRQRRMGRVTEADLHAWSAPG